MGACLSQTSAGAAYLSMLPAVLVQSLMHALQPREILSFARCSKWTLQCADSAFAWRDCPPLRLCFYANVIVPRSPARLLCWLPIALTFDPHRNNGVLSEADAELLLRRLDARPRIVQLDWGQWELPVERGLQLLSHPSMQSVRDLGLNTNMRAEWVAAVASLPCLTHLDLVESALSPADLQPLVFARALRRLYLSDDQGEYLSAVMQLTQLTTLCIHTPRIHGDNFVAFCAAMSGLEELYLARWSPEDVRSISSADLVTGFSSLRCLRMLKFLHSFDAQTLAPALHHAPSLRRLMLPMFASAEEATLLARLARMAPLLWIICERSVDRMALKDARRLLAPMAQ